MRLVGIDVPAPGHEQDRIDHTERLERWAKSRLGRTGRPRPVRVTSAKEGLAEFGDGAGEVYGADGGIPAGPGGGSSPGCSWSGFPRIPVEEEGRLTDPVLGKCRRAGSASALPDLSPPPLSAGAGGVPHGPQTSALSHDRRHYEEMGRLVAAGEEPSIDTLYRKYEEIFMAALAHKATPKSAPTSCRI